jgi:hypothetical protein
VAKDSLTVKIGISGLKETLAAFRALPDEATVALKNASGDIADQVADAIRSRAVATGSQARILADTVKSKRDRVPVVSAGGSVGIGRHRKPAYKLLFGSEFGATHLKQFKARNTSGYWFYPTVTEMKDDMSKHWLAAADEIAKAWSEE